MAKFQRGASPAPTDFRWPPRLFVVVLALALAPTFAACSGPTREDTTYTAWTGCGMGDGDPNPSASCLCTGIRACDAVAGGSWLPLGSEQFRVCGVKDNACVVAAFSEVEGGGASSVCWIPLDADVCDRNQNLHYDNIAAYCLTQSQCNLLMGTCPASVLACP